MKNICVYEDKRYSDSSRYEKVDEHIYRTIDRLSGEPCYVTSLSFEQESDLGEGSGPSDISQYPLEDILDRFMVAVSDFYEAKNSASQDVCYLEFQGEDVQDIRQLLTIAGRHVYNQSSGESVILVIE